MNNRKVTYNKESDSIFCCLLTSFKSHHLFSSAPHLGKLRSKTWCSLLYRANSFLQILAPPSNHIKTASLSFFLILCSYFWPIWELRISPESFIFHTLLGCVWWISFNIQTKCWVGHPVFFCRVATIELFRECSKKLQTSHRRQSKCV